MPQPSTVEKRFERLLFASRWLMAPMYFGLVIALAMLVVTFGKALAYYLPKFLVMSSEDAILAVLTLVDLSLAGNLLLIVMFSGYEAFVSKMDITETVDRPEWMGKLDFSGLKLKLIASIVAISGIHLLKRFMEIGDRGSEVPFNTEELKWLVIIHMTFVFSGLVLAATDWIAARSGKLPKS